MGSNVKKEVTGKGGRIVLFVSHNMAAIENLCSRCILMKNGREAMNDLTDIVVNEYLRENDSREIKSIENIVDRKGDGKIKFNKINYFDASGNEILSIKSGDKSVIRLHYTSLNKESHFANCRISIAVKLGLQSLIILSSELTSKNNITLNSEGYLDFIIEKVPLSVGLYDLTLFLESSGTIHDWFTVSNYLEVVDGNYYGTGVNYPAGWQGKTVLVEHSIKIYSNND